MGKVVSSVRLFVRDRFSALQIGQNKAGWGRVGSAQILALRMWKLHCPPKPARAAQPDSVREERKKERARCQS